MLIECVYWKYVSCKLLFNALGSSSNYKDDEDVAHSCKEFAVLYKG